MLVMRVENVIRGSSAGTDSEKYWEWYISDRSNHSREWLSSIEPIISCTSSLSNGMRRLNSFNDVFFRRMWLNFGPPLTLLELAETVS